MVMHLAMVVVAYKILVLQAAVVLAVTMVVVAVKVMLPRKKIHDVVDALADAGARGIVVTDIRTCRL